MIEERMKSTFENLKITEEKKFILPDPELNGVSKQTLRRFRKVFDKEGPYNICTFENIGIHDPFPDEKMLTTFEIPTNDDHLVYDRSRYMEGNSP